MEALQPIHALGCLSITEPVEANDPKALIANVLPFTSEEQKITGFMAHAFGMTWTYLQGPGYVLNQHVSLLQHSERHTLVSSLELPVKTDHYFEDFSFHKLTRTEDKAGLLMIEIQEVVLDLRNGLTTEELVSAKLFDLTYRLGRQLRNPTESAIDTTTGEHDNPISRMISA